MNFNLKQKKNKQNKNTENSVTTESVLKNKHSSAKLSY